MNSAVLKNEYLELRISRPGDVYNGPRFDWTGIIKDIRFLKHSFCVPEQYKEGKGSGGIGFCNEFGIDRPIGYDSVNVGETFPKIGAGLVTKTGDKPYDFFEKAPLVNAEIVEEVWTDNKYKIVSEINDHKGHNILLTKIITIDNAMLSIYYFLENQGPNKISTNEYNHNFIGIDEVSVGPDYSLYIPALEKCNKIVGDFECNEKTIIWPKTPTDDFYALLELGPMNEGFNWELRQHKSKVGVREFSTFPISKAAIWGYTHTICPELFINIELEGNSTMSWKRIYEFFEY